MAQTRSLKIGLVCPYSIIKGGGVQEIVWAMHQKLTERGHQVRIITFRPRGFEEAIDKDVLFIGTGTDYRAPTHTNASAAVSVDTDMIKHVLDTERFDILHFHEPWVPVLSRQILSRSKAVNIATFHAVIPETFMSRTVIKVVTPYTQSVLKNIHEFTAVSTAAAAYLKSLTHTPVKIIPNGINIDEFKPKNKIERDPHTPLTIFYIGRLERRKGVNYLLRAYKELTQTLENVQLLIAGDGPDREKLEQQAKTLELKNVHFLGYVSNGKRLELLQAADVFCSPAIFGESFGIVLLEAMATGTVTVAGNNHGYTELMKGVGALSIVNPHESDEFARRLKIMLTEKEVRELWQKWASDFVKQFDYEKIIDRYEELYLKAIDKQARML